MVVSLPSAASADPNANTDDRSVMVATKWWFDAGVSLATLQADLAAHKARLTSLEVNAGVTPETFTATMVPDSGAYQVAAWWWGVDRTRAQVTADLQANNGRLIDMYPYQTSSGELYAEIMVVNTGAAARSWWYSVDTDPTTIQSQLNANNARLEEVRSYLINGTEYYAAIMVAQTGIDAKNWTWILNDTPADIQNLLNSFHYRLISLQPDPGGGFDAVMVQSEGETWWWYTGKSQSAVRSLLATNNARPITIAPYSGSSFVVVMIDDTNALSKPLNAESKRVAGLMAKGVGQANYGLYLKQVGGPELLGYNENFRFEPASAIKVMYLLYAMKQVQVGSDSLSADFVYYPDPSDPSNPGVCPDPAWETPSNAVHTTLQAALTAMMDQSDNRMTRGMVLRYGISNVNAFGHRIGMSSTQLAQDRIGCLFVNGVRNQLTLKDIGDLYEQVDNGSLLTAPNEASFYSIMLGGAVPSNSVLANIVRQEAAKQGKTADAASFIAGMNYREKAGNEFQCVSSNCTTTPMYLDFTSVAGRITIPFKSTGNIVPTDYVYSRFANDFVIDCVPGSGSCVADTNELNAINTLGKWGAETYRQQIAAALATW